MSDFFVQLIPQVLPLIILLCGSSVALVIVAGYMRTQQTKKKQLAKAQAAAGTTGRRYARQGDAQDSQKQQQSGASIGDLMSPTQGQGETDVLDLIAQSNSGDFSYNDMPDIDFLLGDTAEPPRGPYHKISEQPVKVRLHTGDDADARELLSILRDERDGRLMIQIGETAYRSLVDSPKAKQQFTRIMKALSAVILKPDAAPPPPPQQAAPQQAAPNPSPAATTPAEKRGTVPGDLPDYSIDPNESLIERGRFGRVRVKKVEEEVPELNIAEAIESYLQYKIAQTPQFQGRGIHIKPALHGGVSIEVGNQQYEFVGDVEDPTIRQFLQQTIAEWQERH